MMNKIEEMVRQRVESELERERTNLSARGDQSVSQSTLPPVDSSMVSSADTSTDWTAYRENLPRMAVLVSSDFMNVEVMEGREVSLEFTVENKSALAWPFRPFV